jgi:diguanylate cyclase (GGDEF)-like protein
VQTSLEEIRKDLVETREVVSEVVQRDFGNARALAESLNDSIDRSITLDRSFCIAMIELEHYANLQEQHGSETFTRILEHLVDVMKSALRETDRVFHLEGGIFILTVPDTLMRGALLVLARIKTLVATSPYAAAGKTIPLPILAGVAEMQAGERGPDMIKRARKALLNARNGKASG